MVGTGEQEKPKTQTEYTDHTAAAPVGPHAALLNANLLIRF